MTDPTDELVLANRIIANEGIVDAFGHVSVRDPEDTARFIISRSLAPANVTGDDLQWLDLDLRLVRGNSSDSYAEVAIHAGIYRARLDVAAVIHSHSPSTVAFGVSEMRLRPVFHMGSLIGHQVPVWDIRDSFGVTNMLVRTQDQGIRSPRPWLMNRRSSCAGTEVPRPGQPFRRWCIRCTHSNRTRGSSRLLWSWACPPS